MKFRNKIIALALAGVFTVSGYFGKEALGDVKLGVLIHSLTSLVLPMISSDRLIVERNSVTFATPVTSFLQTSNNLSEVTNKGIARGNVGLGGGALAGGFASIMDFGADPTGVQPSETAFNSCISTARNCYIPAGIYQLTCNTHTATNGITIFGDDQRTSILKLAAGCAVTATAPTGIINLANLKDITLDLNAATATSPVRIVGNNVGSVYNTSPAFQNIRITNGGTSGAPGNMYLIQLTPTGTGPGNLTNTVIFGNLLETNFASASAPSHCLQILTTGTANTVGGQITGNVCKNAGMSIIGTNITIDNNDISGFAYKSGIQIEQSTNSSNLTITNNRLHDSGFALDSTGSPPNGLLNWARSTLISSNRCFNLGGACIDNGGPNSTITSNYALNNENRTDIAPPLPAYYTLYIDATTNGNGSAWISNYSADDRGAGARQTTGYGDDNILTTNVSLIGNSFNNVTRPYNFSN